jgi:hypothetical protein
MALFYTAYHVKDDGIHTDTYIYIYNWKLKDLPLSLKKEEEKSEEDAGDLCIIAVFNFVID